MQKFLRLCLWQVLIISISCFSLPISAEDGGIRIRGPKSTDAFPYDRYGPITGKDTLWNIALKVRPDPRLSAYQGMQALFENNPDSFKEITKPIQYQIFLPFPFSAGARSILDKC